MNPTEIISKISEARRIPERCILGPTRGTRPVVEARDEIIRILRTEGLSTPQIGEAVNRDHSTVIAALKRTAPIPTPVFRSARKAAQ